MVISNVDVKESKRRERKEGRKEGRKESLEEAAVSVVYRAQVNGPAKRNG